VRRDNNKCRVWEILSKQRASNAFIPLPGVNGFLGRNRSRSSWSRHNRGGRMQKQLQVKTAWEKTTLDKVSYHQNAPTALFLRSPSENRAQKWPSLPQTHPIWA